MNMDAAIRAAIRNIAAHDDTDISLFPFETYLFKDQREKSANLVKAIHADPDAWLATHFPETMPSLAQVGYAGFRWATQKKIKTVV